MAKQKHQSTDDYEVGYGKPPKATQFQKGRSGNPKGRPKGAKNTATLVTEVLDEKVSVRVGDRVRNMSNREVAIRSAVAEARTNVRAFERIMRLEQEERYPAELNGGHPVLVVPGAVSREEWAAVAAAQQAKYAGNTGEDDD